MFFAGATKNCKSLLDNLRLNVHGTCCRLRASRILLVGISGLGAEICKNLVLSGVKSVTIVDPSPLTEDDLVSQFLAPRQDLGKNVSSFVKVEECKVLLCLVMLILSASLPYLMWHCALIIKAVE